MMLKRLSQMLVAMIVTIAMMKPTTRPRCTLAHLNAKWSAIPESSPRRENRLAAAAISAAPEREPDEGPRDRGHDRVAPAFGRERADQRAPAEPDRAQHPELRLPLVGEHEEDVDEEQDPRQHRERAERRVQPRQRVPAARRPIEHRLLAVVDARGDAHEMRGEHAVDRVGSLGTGFDPARVGHEDDRLRRARPQPLCARRRCPAIVPGPNEDVVRRRFLARPEARDAPLREDACDLERHGRCRTRRPGWCRRPSRATCAPGRRRSRHRRRPASGRRSRLRPRRHRTARPPRTPSPGVGPWARPAPAWSSTRPTRWAAVIARTPSTFGSRRPASFDWRTGAAASPFAETISSIGPSCSYAIRRIEELNVSPTTNEPVMIAVPSSDPRMTSAVSRGRRTALRSASRRRIGLRNNTKTNGSERIATRIIGVSVRGARRDRLHRR